MNLIDNLKPIKLNNLLYKVIFLTCLFVTSGCTQSSIRASLTCAAKPDSFECAIARDSNIQSVKTRKMIDACIADENSKECDIAKNEHEGVNTGEEKKATQDDKYILNNKDLSAVKDKNYDDFVTLSQNQEWVVLRGNGGNFYEIKNINTSESRFWYGDDHESSSIRAVSNDGKFILYIHGRIFHENKDGRFKLILQDIDRNKVHSTIHLKYYPEITKISPKGNFVAFYNRTIPKNDDEITIYRINQNTHSMDIAANISMEGNKASSIDSFFKFSSDESRFITISKDIGINIYDVKSGFTSAPAKNSLEMRLNSSGKTASYAKDRVADAIFLEKTNRLVILLETQIFQDLHAKDFLSSRRRKLTIAVEKNDGSLLSNIVATEPELTSNEYHLYSNKDGNYAMLNRVGEFEFHFFSLASDGRIERQSKCCVDAATTSESVINFYDKKPSPFSMKGFYMNNDSSFKILLKQPYQVYYPIVIDSGKWTRVNKW